MLIKGIWILGACREEDGETVVWLGERRENKEESACI